MIAGESTSNEKQKQSTSSGSIASDFRSKVAFMKNWKPATSPSNRDKLELYALHKQAVSSDAPITSSPSSKASSPAEKAKLAAWRTKRGLTQAHAMNAYIIEADRQVQVYGTSTSTNTGSNEQESDNGSASGSNSILLMPRGLAAIPLLCAAASESRASYLHRIGATTQVENGWWIRQEPLCGDPGSIFALPEHIVLTLAVLVEKLSLYVQSDTIKRILSGLNLKASVVQSLLWPAHNLLIVIWMMVIFLTTVTGSVLLTLKTLLLGSKRTGLTLENIFVQEIRPCRLGTQAICEPHQMATVRLLGLVLYPLGMLCKTVDGLVERDTPLLVASSIFVCVGLFGWWYLYLVLPWLAASGLVFALSVGWCFALIELAGSSLVTR